MLANDPELVFYLASLYENKQIHSNISLQGRRGTKHTLENGQNSFNIDDSYAFLNNMKNTPRYWQIKRYEMFARLENLGPFHFFFTLSCADLRWAENFTTLLDGHDIVFERQNGQENILVDNIPLELKQTSVSFFINQG